MHCLVIFHHRQHNKQINTSKMHLKKQKNIWRQGEIGNVPDGADEGPNDVSAIQCRFFFLFYFFREFEYLSSCWGISVLAWRSFPRAKRAEENPFAVTHPCRYNGCSVYRPRTNLTKAAWQPAECPRRATSHVLWWQINMSSMIIGGFGIVCRLPHGGISSFSFLVIFASSFFV